ncbi:hypothetical protein G6L37_00655 [Agrobacterium rubi]|nr:hypothetical protein [Agrobacterium rubi]NTF23900.1 hypothetical protein [Agrobacterium rubi]
MIIKTTPVTEFNVRCPSCNNILLACTAHDSKVPDGGYLIQDGDSIYAVWQGLSEEERARSWDAGLSVGTCRGCEEGYYFANVCLSDAPKSRLVQEYLYQNLNMGPETNYVCSTGNETDGKVDWLMNEWKTKIGLVQCHYLGPWRLPSMEDFMAEDDATACMTTGSVESEWDGAARATLSLWNEMRRICSEHTASTV